MILFEEQLRNHTCGEGKIKIHVIALNRKTATIDNIQSLMHVQKVSHIEKNWRTAKLCYQPSSPSEILFSNDPTTKVQAYSVKYCFTNYYQ